MECAHRVRFSSGAVLSAESIVYRIVGKSPGLEQVRTRPDGRRCRVLFFYLTQAASQLKSAQTAKGRITEFTHSKFGSQRLNKLSIDDNDHSAWVTWWERVSLCGWASWWLLYIVKREREIWKTSVLESIQINKIGGCGRSIGGRGCQLFLTDIVDRLVSLCLCFVSAAVRVAVWFVRWVRLVSVRVTAAVVGDCRNDFRISWFEFCFEFWFEFWFKVLNSSMEDTNLSASSPGGLRIGHRNLQEIKRRFSIGVVELENRFKSMSFNQWVYLRVRSLGGRSPGVRNLLQQNRLVQGYQAEKIEHWCLST